MRNNKIQQIWSFQFLEVVQLHILGVLDNVLHCFVVNLINGFPAVKELWKPVKIWRNYRHKRVARFLDTVYNHKCLHFFRLKISAMFLRVAFRRLFGKRLTV